MEALKEILSPDFLLRNSVYTSVLIGFACPLVGVFLVLRRLVFMGVALPQISSTGVAISLSVPFWLGANPSHAEHSEHLIAFAGSMFFTLAAILLLAFFERRGKGLPEGRLGTAYVVASALSILLLSKNRYAEVGWLDLLKGEIIAIDNYDLIITAATLAVVLGALLLFHKEFLFVSFDRAMAATLGKNVLMWDVAIYLPTYRRDGFCFRVERRAADLLRLLAHPGADGTSFCAQHAAIVRSRLVDRWLDGLSRLLAGVSMGLAHRPDGSSAAGDNLRSRCGHKENLLGHG